MNEENSKVLKEENGIGGKTRKNVCCACRKSIFEDNSQTTMCINLKRGGVICLNCAYEIEYALEAAEFGETDFWTDDEPERKQDDLISMPEEDTKKYSYLNLPNKKDVVKKIQGCVIGQDNAIVRIVNILYRNFLSTNKELKSTPLLIGKSGNGKTEIITEFCKLINVPFVVENAKDFTEAGYVGRDPLEMFKDLYNTSGTNLKLASNGIIVIDEIDKLREPSGIEKDVSGSGVINTLLSYISGVKVPIKDNFNNVIAYLNTENIKFIFLGAFEDANDSCSLYKIREERLSEEKHIGFNTNTSKKTIKNSQKSFIAEDLIKYGFSRQFVGRVSIVELNELTKEDFMKIMLKSKISVYKAFEREFASYGVKMVCSNKLNENIIEAAIDKKIGARGIKVVCEDAFLTALEEVENIDYVTCTEVIFNDNVIEDSLNYKLV